MKTRLLIAIAAALLLAQSGGVSAQPVTPGTQPPVTPGTQPPAPRRPLFGRRHTRTTTFGSQAPITGGIVGNKRTHVYHLPGDTGNLPAEKNRVYFASEAAARAAGYHAAGKRGAGSKTLAHRRTNLRRIPGSSVPRRPLNTTPPTPPTNP